MREAMSALWSHRLSHWTHQAPAADELQVYDEILEDLVHIEQELADFEARVADFPAPFPTRHP